jgi:uncharacterized membrane protein
VSVPAGVVSEPPKREHQRTHFTRRLEAFSDIVFGLSLAQTAIQLQVPANADELNHHFLRYLVFFGTFALIAFLWMAHYRIFRLAFEPEGLDIFLNFVFLAFTALLPYAMQTNIKFQNEPFALGLYAVSFMGTSLPLLVICLRGLARRDPTLTDAERLLLWKASLRNASVSIAAFITLTLLPFLPTYFAILPFPVLMPVMVFIRRRATQVPALFRLAPA